MVGVRPKRREPIKPVLRVILAAAICAVVVLDILSSHPSYFVLVYLPLGLGWSLWVAKRPPTVVSPTGIRRPGRWTSSLSWDEVDFVDAPVAGVYGTKVTLRSGKGVVLDDVPAAQSKAVAALGRKQVKAAPRSPMPMPMPMPVPPSRERTATDIYADVTRQAELLARQSPSLPSDHGKFAATAMTCLDHHDDSLTGPVKRSTRTDSPCLVPGTR